ncbi:unnamed protein product [Ilex paraguariensis]|uniref:Pentatricopeptide repeat-containing protein n=1 Tax=Ilex paraguariensis TaxID=185542 RepID=A0ABC8R0B7_9AQUA
MNTVLTRGEQIHVYAVNIQFDGNVFVVTGLVNMYSKCYSQNGDLHKAIKCFQDMRSEGVGSLCSRFCSWVWVAGLEEEARRCLKKCVKNMDIDDFTYPSVLNCRASKTDMENAKSFWNLGNKFMGVLSNFALVHPYQSTIHAIMTIEKESLQFYDEIIASGTKPHFITFIGLLLLFARSHAGLTEHGHHYLESMDKVYGIKPGPDHYACTIDLLGCSGKMREAKELLNEMVVEPDAIVWKALLAGMYTHVSPLVSTLFISLSLSTYTFAFSFWISISFFKMTHHSKRVLLSSADSCALNFCTILCSWCILPSLLSFVFLFNG